MLRCFLVFFLLASVTPAIGQQLTNRRDFDGGHEDFCVAAFSPSGDRLYHAGFGKEVRVRDPRTGEQIKSIAIKERSYTWGLSVSPDNRLLAVARDRDVVLVSLPDGKTLRVFKRLAGTVSFGVDGKSLITLNSDRQLRYWDPEAGGNTASYPTGGTTFRVSADRRLAAIYSYSADGEIEIWDLSKRKIVRRLTVKRSLSGRIGLSSDGALIATFKGGADAAVYLWDAKTGEQLWKSAVRYRDQIESFAFSPGSKLLAAAGRNDVTLWDTATGERLAEQRGSGKLTFSPDGKSLVLSHGVSEYEGGVVVWDVE